MISILPMTLEDIPQVVEIDHLSFPIPWSAASYKRELLENEHAHFFVAVNPAQTGWRRWLGHPPRRDVVGYMGYWCIVDEAHISTLAVHPRWRRHGVGEQLLRAVLRHAAEHGAVEATLEVRATNRMAQSLYRKFGFAEVGRRRHYYRDNGEDAVLMTMKLLGAAVGAP